MFDDICAHQEGRIKHHKSEGQQRISTRRAGRLCEEVRYRAIAAGRAVVDLGTGSSRVSVVVVEANRRIVFGGSSGCLAVVVVG